MEMLGEGEGQNKNIGCGFKKYYQFSKFKGLHNT